MVELMIYWHLPIWKRVQFCRISWFYRIYFFCGYGTNQSYRSSYVQYVTDYTYKCRETFSQTVYADLVQFFGAVTLEYKSRLCTGVLLGWGHMVLDLHSLWIYRHSFLFCWRFFSKIWETYESLNEKTICKHCGTWIMSQLWHTYFNFLSICVIS